MGLASLRHGARPLLRAGKAPSRATRADSRLGPLRYLSGWWYGTLDLLGCDAVRVRLPGDLGGPASRARVALLTLERPQHAVLDQLAPHLWSVYSGARGARRVRVNRSPARADTLDSILPEHFRLEAVCAGAFGDEALLELALAPRWAPEQVLGAYVRAHSLVEFRPSIGLWRTPD